MNSIERHEKIKQLLEEHQDMQVKELAREFKVSEMTIRRDLHFLEKQGSVELFFGGVRKRAAYSPISMFNEREGVNYDAKRKIARKASELFLEGHHIYIDTSTTLTLLVRLITDMKMSVVTNSLSVVMELVSRKNIDLYVAPGLYLDQYGGSFDYATVEYLKNFHFDEAFFGTSAIDPAYGITASKEIEMVVKKAVMRQSDKCYLLCDHTKLGKKHFFKMNDIYDFDALYIDDEIDEESLQKLKEMTQVVVCD